MLKPLFQCRSLPAVCPDDDSKCYLIGHKTLYLFSCEFLEYMYAKIVCAIAHIHIITPPPPPPPSKTPKLSVTHFLNNYSGVQIVDCVILKFHVLNFPSFHIMMFFYMPMFLLSPFPNFIGLPSPWALPGMISVVMVIVDTYHNISKTLCNYRFLL